MIEDSSLVLLANVALDNRLKINPQKKGCLKKRDSRIKTLKVTQLNGEDHAEITDLKCMPISTLFKIFIEKFEDKKTNCCVYLCKYGQKQSCNTRFSDFKENRVNRLEHLVQCHLLEHLTKTKTGSMIKIPKTYITTERTVPSINESKSFKINSKYEEVEWQVEDSKITDFIKTKPEKKLVELEIKPQSRVTINEIDNSSKHVEIIADSKKPESHSETSINNMELNIRRVKFDHSYSNIKDTSSNTIPVSSMRGAMIPIEYQKVDIDKLYYLNSESSSELNNFMMHETLNKPVPIVTTDDEKSTIEQLPLVGCEAEVTTEKEYIEETVNAESKAEKDDSYFSCTKCDIVLSSKHVFYLHMKNRHSDSTIFKQNKMSQNRRTLNTESKTVKRKFDMVPEYRNTDLSEVVKENKTAASHKVAKKGKGSILKTALLKESNSKKPVINISNVWNSINVQYVQ